MRSRLWMPVLSVLSLHLTCGSASAQEPGDSIVPADTQMTVHVSLGLRRLWVVASSGDTLYTARVAVGSGTLLRASDREWRFATPTGESRVASKQVAPLWVPPDWHYVEIANRNGLAVRSLRARDVILLDRGRKLVVRGAEVGVLGKNGFRPLPANEEIIFGDTLFIPPFGTTHRQIPGVLGAYRLLLDNGIGLHGTDAEESIGKAVTHGCIRLLEADITWLYANVPLRARVVIY